MHFNPRSPCGERPGHPAPAGAPSPISIHAPRVGSDRGAVRSHTGYTGFQSTLPVWGATIDDLSSQLSVMLISIHAPRVGSDGVVEAIDVFQEISIHAPRVGSDEEESTAEDVVTLFQSTLPVWGATRTMSSAHSWTELFQSTLPVWGATGNAGTRRGQSVISIHAPRVGSDAARARRASPGFYFNPRSPCGERLYVQRIRGVFKAFQSTLPVWGATVSEEVEAGHV